MTNSAPSSRRIGRVLVDDGLAWILAALAAAGSFTHIRGLALRSGQHGWMADAIAVCIDLMCVMAVRERKRDQRLNRRCGRVTWPTVVLTMGICLTIAANLASAQPTAWGWIVAATPAGTFLIAVSMLERRASLPEQPTLSPAYDRSVDAGHAGSEPGPDSTARARPHPGPLTSAVDLASMSAAGDATPDIEPDMKGVMASTGARRRRGTDTELRAPAVLARRPEATGADLGRALGVTERHGRRLRSRLSPLGA